MLHRGDRPYKKRSNGRPDLRVAASREHTLASDKPHQGPPASPPTLQAFIYKRSHRHAGRIALTAPGATFRPGQIWLESGRQGRELAHEGPQRRFSRLGPV